MHDWKVGHQQNGSKGSASMDTVRTMKFVL